MGGGRLLIFIILMRINQEFWPDSGGGGGCGPLKTAKYFEIFPLQLGLLLEKKWSFGNPVKDELGREAG